MKRQICFFSNSQVCKSSLYWYPLCIQIKSLLYRSEQCVNEGVQLQSSVNCCDIAQLFFLYFPLILLQITKKFFLTSNLRNRSIQNISFVNVFTQIVAWIEVSSQPILRNTRNLFIFRLHNGSRRVQISIQLHFEWIRIQL